MWDVSLILSLIWPPTTFIQPINLPQFLLTGRVWEKITVNSIQETVTFIQGNINEYFIIQFVHVLKRYDITTTLGIAGPFLLPSLCLVRGHYLDSLEIGPIRGQGVNNEDKTNWFISN